MRLVLQLLIVVSCLVPLCLSLPNGAALQWPADRALPIFPELGPSIEYANLSQLSGDEQGLLVSLQGLVNRQQPCLYFYWPEGLQNDYDGSNEGWLQELDLSNSVDVTGAPLELIEKYRSEINGAIVYDASVRDSINLATTLAGIHGAVVATEELARTFDIPIIEDLRGRFKDKYEVYEYALQNVWPNVTDRLITAISPISTMPFFNRTWTTLLRASSRITDKSNNGTYEVDLSKFLNPSGSVYVNITDAFTDDGFGPSVWHVTVVADDDQVIADFQPGTDLEEVYLFDVRGSQLANYPGGWRFADGQGGMTYKFDYPPGTRRLSLFLTMWNQFEVMATASKPGYQKLNPVFRDYIVATGAPCLWLDGNKAAEAELLDRVLRTLQPNAAYLGWFPNGDEMAGVTQTAEHGVYVAATDWLWNPTFFSGTRPTTAPAGAQFNTVAPQRTHATTTTTTDGAKVYLSLTYLEGDNIQYNQHRMYTHWNDEARGSVPLGWTISPLLRDIGPGMLSYYQATATPNDLLVAGPDGAGYTYPTSWPADALTLYLAQATETDRVLFAYNRVNATDVPLPPALAAAFRDAVGADRLGGILYGDFVDAVEDLSVNVTAADRPPFPVANMVGLGDERGGAATLRNLSARWNATAGPLFVAGAVDAWHMRPANVSRMVARLGPGFEVLRPDAWFEKLRAALEDGSYLSGPGAG